MRELGRPSTGERERSDERVRVRKLSLRIVHRSLGNCDEEREFGSHVPKGGSERGPPVHPSMFEC